MGHQFDRVVVKKIKRNIYENIGRSSNPFVTNQFKWVNALIPYLVLSSEHLNLISVEDYEYHEVGALFVLSSLIYLERC